MQGGKGWLGSWTQNTFGAILPRESATAEKRSEQSARIFPIDFDRSPVADIGYTGRVQFDDGEIYMIDYLVDDAPKAQIRASAFRAEEFLLSGDK
jgi:sialidase-1